MPGTLYVVATPIGNLEDLTERARRILGEVDRIACEDTRRTRVLLRHCGLQTPAESYHQFSERRKLERFLELLRSGRSVALVSDAGTPTLSDPGALLVGACRREGIPVVPVPGASALLAAVSASTFAGQPFLFWGFLPAKRKQRRDRLAALTAHSTPMVFYETPARLIASLEDMREVLGDRALFLGREMTKAFEETVEGSITEILERFRGAEVRGEITLIVAGAEQEERHVDLAAAVAEARESIRKEGISKKEAARRAAATSGHPTRAVYQELVKE